MKKTVAAILVLFVLFFTTSVAHAGDNAMTKLGRGVANVATSPLAIFQSMGSAKEENGIVAGMTSGVLEGVVNLLKRALVGVYEIATFPVPIPAGYEPILEDPEFFLQSETPY